MTLQERLAALRGKGLLVEHQPSQTELQQHLDNASDQIGDARNPAVSALGRFNAAYGASHALLTAALKMRGLRTGSGLGHRQLLFDLLDQLLPAAAAAKAVLSQAHVMRNKAEYDGGTIHVTGALVQGLVKAAENLDEETRLAFKAFLKAKAGPAA